MPGSPVEEWVEKAEEDWVGCQLLRAGEPGRMANLTSYHAQQCAEKYLKGLLQKLGTEPPHTHSLPRLLDMLSDQFPHLEALGESCEFLDPYAVNFRYPGQTATAEEAVEALGWARAIRATIRDELGLPPLD